jgi:RNA polymerase sigma-70 factor (ECF subfamily)
MDIEDDELIRRARAGDTSAFGELVTRYQRPIYTMALRMLGNPQDAQDAAQMTFVRAYRGLSGFDEDRRFFSWLYRIGVNECLNARRTRRPEEALNRAIPASGSPFESAAASERTAHLQAALQELSPEYRAVIVLRHFSDLSYDEMADALGVPVTTIKSRLYAARQRLGEQLLGWRAS